ncbi:MAG: HAMP domain-containing histidine kinase [Defluviitaleaceae bacterium]|nr:HAMP domain-containing histidine kinase [Defluviitaleaceae bacterium]
MSDDFSEMTAALAHEIKNPAAVALAHVNLLRLEDEKSNLDHHLNHIEQALYNICNMVKDMLSATYNGCEAYEVNLSNIIHEILETYRAAWPEISFIFEGEGFLPCYGHETSLRMIFSNLIKNAVEAVEAANNQNSVITISASYRDEFLNVLISDTGIVYSTQDKPHGNGLGLAICKNLANGIGAEISAQHSEDGCTVSVNLRTLRTLA